MSGRIATLMIAACCGFMACTGTATTDAGPVTLLVYNPGEQLTLEQQRARLYYGRNLRPVIQGDSLAVPKVEGEMPEEFMAYAADYAALLNRYIKQVPEARREFLFDIYNSWDVGHVIMMPYLELKGSNFVVTLDRESAIEIGLEPDYYDRQMREIENSNRFIDSLSKQDDSIELPDRLLPDTQASIFFDHNFFDMVASDIGMEDLQGEFEELNRRYMKE